MPRSSARSRPARSRMAAFLLAGLCLGAGPALAQDGPVVRTQAGPVRGAVAGGVLQALGIPYASPPVGELRWALPAASRPWTEPRDATRFGPACPQPKELGDFDDASTAEDCLTLNVFAPAPAAAPSGPRPVMVWIHGGATTGSARTYDGSDLVRDGNVVVVTFNYRLGALGALVHPALDGGGATTLYGLRDEQFALQWVKDNIAAFGGDPNNVTLFGESTGATDVVFHMISPTARGLFQRAILQSPSRYFNPLVSLAQAEEKGRAFAAAAGCPDGTAACLRGLPVAALLAAQGSFGSDCCATLPINDGHMLDSTIADAIRSGRFNRVPVLDMTTRDENVWFQAFTEIGTGRPVAAADYPARLKALYGANADAVLQAYPLSAFDAPGAALGAVTGDNSAICQTRSFDVDASRFVKVYAAEFDDPTSPGILPPVSFPLRASHTHEIQYLFTGWKGVSAAGTALNPAQAALARSMRGIWTTFAATGELPPDYPAVGRDRLPVVSLRIPRVAVVDDSAATHHCALWNSMRGWTPAP